MDYRLSYFGCWTTKNFKDDEKAIKGFKIIAEDLQQLKKYSRIYCRIRRIHSKIRSGVGKQEEILIKRFTVCKKIS